jgi:DNA-binding transcriptional regulator YiaG
MHNSLEKISALGMLAPMPEKASERLRAELKAWCDQKRGRRAELARMMNVSPQLVSDWVTGRKIPTLDDGLKLIAFLKKHRRRSAPAAPQDDNTP